MNLFSPSSHLTYESFIRSAKMIRITPSLGWVIKLGSNERVGPVVWQTKHSTIIATESLTGTGTDAISKFQPHGHAATSTV